MKMPKTYLNWSSGKDAMLALDYCSKSVDFPIERLVTSVNTAYERVSMHGVRKELLGKQADALGIPLQIMYLDGSVSLPEYNRVQEKQTRLLVEEGFTHSVFGDIFLEDLRKYREQQLMNSGITPVFPLWKKNTKVLVQEFIERGYKAVVVCTSAQKLDKSFCGRVIDNDFLKDLPPEVDPCGEHGEFHSFVFDGPLFSTSIPVKLGERVMRDFSPSEDDDCFTEKQSWDNKFWFQELQLKA